MDQKQKNLKLATELVSQVEEVIDDFVRENLDMNLDMDDLVEQHNDITDYIVRNLYR